VKFSDHNSLCTPVPSGCDSIAPDHLKLLINMAERLVPEAALTEARAFSEILAMLGAKLIAWPVQILFIFIHKVPTLSRPSGLKSSERLPSSSFDIGVEINSTC